MLRTRLPLIFIDVITEDPLDLHALNTPPTFILSQDQTLRRNLAEVQLGWTKAGSVKVTWAPLYCLEFVFSQIDRRYNRITDNLVLLKVFAWTNYFITFVAIVVLNCERPEVHWVFIKPILRRPNEWVFVWIWTCSERALFYLGLWRLSRAFGLMGVERMWMGKIMFYFSQF